jgi:hypothetical protein
LKEVQGRYSTLSKQEVKKNKKQPYTYLITAKKINTKNTKHKQTDFTNDESYEFNE